MWNALGRLTGDRTDVDAILAEVQREWKRLRLQTTNPATPPVLIETNRPRFTSESGGSMYSPGVPDEMKVRQ